MAPKAIALRRGLSIGVTSIVASYPSCRAANAGSYGLWAADKRDRRAADGVDMVARDAHLAGAAADHDRIPPHSLKSELPSTTAEAFPIVTAPTR
jgi:hypothetical protein